MSRMKTRGNICFRERVKVENRIAQKFPEEWGWLVQEYEKQHKELQEIFNPQEAKDSTPKADLKPFPPTTAGMIGWLSTRPNCKLEVYGPDVPKAKPLPDIYIVTRLNNPLSDGLEYCK